MLITAAQYPDFTTETHLEELTLNMARQIVVWSRGSQNTEGIDFVSASTDEEAETTTIGFSELRAEIVGGTIKIKDYFAGAGFQAGTGAYPFDRTSIVDAFFHLAIYQHNFELRTANNPEEDNIFIEWDVAGIDAQTLTEGVSANIALNDYPVIFTLNNGSLCSVARPYLSA